MNNYRYRQTGYREWLQLFDEGKLNEVQAAFFRTKPAEALYDLEQDPYETNNLVIHQDYAETLEMMRGRLTSWMMDLPDLSLYPEHYLIKNAFNNPVEFGQSHKESISEYLEIADLALCDFEEVNDRIGEAINSVDPWKRYWGLVVCSRFADKALKYSERIKTLAASDEELINRVRAAEFLGIVRVEDPSDYIRAALYESIDPNEALLILNSIVLMQDGYNYKFELESEKIHEAVANEAQVKRRLEYLNLM